MGWGAARRRGRVRSGVARDGRSAGQELERRGDELLVELEDPAVPGVG
jgi:hypothetical protein